MWEKRLPWEVQTRDGAKSLEEISDADDFKHLMTAQVRGLSIQGRCNGCNLPGGGLNKVCVSRETPDEPTEKRQGFPDGETIACSQTLKERAACESIKVNLQQILHDSKLCDPLNCSTCLPRSGASIKPGQVIAFRGNVTKQHPQLGSIAIPQRFLGRFICRDALGVCFELVSVETGPTGMRMWLTDSGYFCEDLFPDDQKQIDEGKRKKPSGLVLPEQFNQGT